MGAFGVGVENMTVMVFGKLPEFVLRDLFLVVFLFVNYVVDESGLVEIGDDLCPVGQ